MYYMTELIESSLEKNVSPEGIQGMTSLGLGPRLGKRLGLIWLPAGAGDQDLGVRLQRLKSEHSCWMTSGSYITCVSFSSLPVNKVMPISEVVQRKMK